MGKQEPNPYLKTKIMTARSHELRQMLYDGAIKFCRNAKAAINNQDHEISYDHLMRAQKIVLELSTSLNHDFEPSLCQKLSALYTYIYRLLVDANMHRQTESIDEAIKLLNYQRETWKMLMEKLAEQENRGDTHSSQITGAQQTAISSFQQ